MALVTVHLCSPDPSSRSTNLRVKSLHVLEALRNRAHPMRRSLAMMLTSPGLPPQDLGTGRRAKSWSLERAAEGLRPTPASWHAARFVTLNDPLHNMLPDDIAFVSRRTTRPDTDTTCHACQPTDCAGSRSTGPEPLGSAHVLLYHPRAT